MTFSIIGSTGANSGATSAALDTTNADLLVAVTTNDGATGLTDSYGNTWTHAINSGTTTVSADLYYCRPDASHRGTSHTFANAANPSVAIAVLAIIGAKVTGALDQVVGQYSTGPITSPYTAGSLTPSENGEIIIGGATGADGADAPYTHDHFTPVVPTTGPYSISIAHRVQATAAASAIDWTWTGSPAGTRTVAASFRVQIDPSPPTLTSPTGAPTSTTTATGTVTTNNGSGTLYGVATLSSTPPTATQIRAGQNSAGAAATFAANVAVTSTGAKTFNATGLAASTSYTWHFTQRDGASGDALVVSANSFTTPAPGDTTPPVLTSPLGAATGTTTASGGVTTDEGNGTLYAGVWPTATTPTAAQVKAGTGATYWNGGIAVTSVGAKTTAAIVLAAATSYRWHYVHRDASGNDSTPVSSSSAFSTFVGGASGTLTTGPFKNNTTTLQPSLTGLAVQVLSTTGALVISLTGQTTNGSGVFAVTDPAITPGTQYHLAFIDPATGRAGISNRITAT